MIWKCEQCEYWDSPKGEHGDCHINPPVVITDGYEVGSTGYLTVWPETSKNDGCAKIKLKREMK